MKCPHCDVWIDVCSPCDEHRWELVESELLRCSSWGKERLCESAEWYSIMEVCEHDWEDDPEDGVGSKICPKCFITFSKSMQDMNEDIDKEYGRPVERLPKVGQSGWDGFWR